MMNRIYFAMVEEETGDGHDSSENRVAEEEPENEE